MRKKFALAFKKDQGFSSKNFKGQKALDFDKFPLTNCHSMYQFVICTSQVLSLYLAQNFLSQKNYFSYFIQATTFFRDLVNTMNLAFSGCLQFTKSKQYVRESNSNLWLTYSSSIFCHWMPAWFFHFSGKAQNHNICFLELIFMFHLNSIYL